MLGRPYKKRSSENKPFPSFPGPLYQNKVKCSAFDMEMVFHSYANKTHFHKKCCAFGLILKERGGFWNLEVAYRGVNRDGHSWEEKQKGIHTNIPHSPTSQTSYYEKKLKRPNVFHSRYLKHLYFTPSVSFEMSSEKGLDVNVLGVGRDSVYIPAN